MRFCTNPGGGPRALALVTAIAAYLPAAAVEAGVIDLRELAGNVDYGGLGPVGPCGGQDLWAQSVLADGRLLEEVRVRGTHVANGPVRFDLVITGARGDGGGGQGLAPNFADIRSTAGPFTIDTGDGTAEIAARPGLIVAPGETLFIVIDTWTHRATSGCGSLRGTNVSRYADGEMVKVAAAGGEADLFAFDARAWEHPPNGVDLAILASFHDVVGQAAGDQFGWAADAVGDVTGDGVGDFIVGAPLWKDKGRAYVYDATLGRRFTLTGGAREDRFGWAVAGVGDVDHDGTRDVAVGAPYHDGQRGEVTVFSGVDGAKIWSLDGAFPGDRLGWALDGDIDIDGDRRPDLIVGAPKNDETGSSAGKAYIFRGSDGRVFAVLRGEAAGDLFGTGVAALDRVDGFREGGIVIGAPKNDEAASNAGKVYVYSAGAARLLYVLRGKRQGDLFGSAIAAIGLIDDDNKTDFAVSAPKYDRGDRADAGRVDVYSSADGSRLFKGIGAAGGDRYGSALAAAGDVDGDGRADLLVGAPRHDATGANAGRVYVVRGRNGGTIMVRDGARGGDLFGQALAGPGDLDGDGVPDPFVGAPRNDVAGGNAGRGRIGRSASGLLPAGWLDPVLAGAHDDGDDQDDDRAIRRTTFAPDADLNGDGDVNLDDLVLLLTAWGGDALSHPFDADLDGDGDVNEDDLLTLLAALEERDRREIRTPSRDLESRRR